MYSEKGELTSCRVCLVWYVVCRGRMYVVRCLVGVSSLLLYKEVGSRWKSQRSLFARLSASAGRCTSSPPIITQAFPVTVNICCWYCNNNLHGLTWTAFNILLPDILAINNNTTIPHNAVRHFAGLGHAQPASVQIHPTGSQRGASMDRRHSRPLITAWRPVGRSQRWNRAVRAG